MTSVVLLWEGPDGERCWEAVKEEQYGGFLVQLLNRGVHPATVMVAYAPILFRWVWKKFHKGLSDVYFQKINEEIYGTEPAPENAHMLKSIKIWGISIARRRNREKIPV